MTDQTESSENRFKRLFKEHPVGAKAQAKLSGSAPSHNPTALPSRSAFIAAAIAAAQANAEAIVDQVEREDGVIDVEAIDVPTIGLPPADVALPPAVAPKSKPANPLAPKTRTKLDPDPKRGRGRPSNGKRSNQGWASRTFYIRKATDDRLQQAIFSLRRSGIEVDKSQLADALLNAWAAVELGEVEDFHIGEMLEKPAKPADD
jgi:hypothetical protein